MILKYVSHPVQELWKHYMIILMWFEQNAMLSIIVFLSIRLIRWFIDEKTPLFLLILKGKKVTLVTNSWVSQLKVTYKQGCFPNGLQMNSAFMNVTWILQYWRVIISTTNLSRTEAPPHDHFEHDAAENQYFFD